MNLSLNVDDLVAELDCATRPSRTLEPSWNLPPTSELYIIADRRPRGDESAAPVRRLEIARWGLVPSWAKDPSVGARMFNARSETVADKPAYRSVFARKRCVIPANGYYEWQQIAGKKRKQPYYIHAEDGDYVLFAGVFDFWSDPSKSDDEDDRWLVSTSVVTAAARGELAELHHRMPVIVAEDDMSDWLDPDAGKDDATDVLARQIATEPDRLAFHPVSSEVGSVAVNRPDLPNPVAAEHGP